MDNIYKAVQLTIDSQNLALSKTPTHIYIANQYVDTNDTPLITAPFIIQKALENGTGVVDIVSSTIGSIYEVRLLCEGETLISGYFYMPPMNVKFSELELYTSYPPRTPPVIDEFWQKTENFILEKTNTLLNFVQVFNAVSGMRLNLGYLEELATEKKHSLVAAINEIFKLVEPIKDNGWTTDLIEEDGLTQRIINKLNIRCLESVADLANIKKPFDGQVVFVKSYYANQAKGAHHRIYKSSKATINNGTTCINGWEIYFSNAKYISTDMIGLKDGQSCVLQIRSCLEFLNSKGGGTLNIDDGNYLCEAKHLITNSWGDKVSAYRYWFAVYSNLTIQGSKNAVLKAEAGIVGSDNGYAFEKGFQFFVDTDDTNNMRQNVTIKGFTLDANGQQNLQLPREQGGGKAAVNFVAFLQTKNIFVDNMLFKNNSGQQPFVIEQKCKNLVLENCTFENMGGGIVGNTSITDHSTIYIVADSYVVRNNRFINKQHGPGTTGTAMELHGTNGLAEKNYIENYDCPFIHAAGEKDSVNITIRDNKAVNVYTAFSIWALENYKISANYVDNYFEIVKPQNRITLPGIYGNFAIASYGSITETFTGVAEIYSSGNVFYGYPECGIGNLARLDKYVSTDNKFYGFGSGYILSQASHSRNAFYEITDTFVDCGFDTFLNFVYSDTGRWPDLRADLWVDDEHLTVNIASKFMRHTNGLVIIDAGGINTCYIKGFVKIDIDNKVSIYRGNWNSPSVNFEINATGLNVARDSGTSPNNTVTIETPYGTYTKPKGWSQFRLIRYGNGVWIDPLPPGGDFKGDIFYSLAPSSELGWVCVGTSSMPDKQGIWQRIGVFPIENTSDYDFPNLATGTQQSTFVWLPGAKIGDNVSVSFNQKLQGTRLWAEVVEANKLTVYHRNDTGQTVDLPSGTLTVKIV